MDLAKFIIELYIQRCCAIFVFFVFLIWYIDYPASSMGLTPMQFNE